MPENPFKKISNFIKESKGSINFSLGQITSLEQIGQGGNGLVYRGIQNNKEVAVKFLVETNESKLVRFKAEYFNVKILENTNNIVNYINYEELNIADDGYRVPAIVMKKYEKSLKKYREDFSINEETFLKLFYFLLDSLENIHGQGIIHRDIKPENILVTKDENFVLADFGIASYNPDIFSLKAETRKGDRLANFEFSAPEQTNKDITATPTMDIYALGQVCHWYVFGKVHKGTNRSRITEVFKSVEIEILDIILNKCLFNDFTERYQSIKEIRGHIQKLNRLRNEVDPFKEMRLFNDAIRATCPSVSKGLQVVEEEKYIRRLVENINNKSFQDPLWYNTGRGNNSFERLEYLGDRKILIDYREVKVKRIWLYSGSTYDDFLMFETEKIESFKTDEGDSDYALIINDEQIVMPYYLDAGYIEIDDEVFVLDELKVEERYRTNDYDYICIGTRFHCSMLMKNDKALDDFHEQKDVTKNEVLKLIKELRRNKHDEVYLRL